MSDELSDWTRVVEHVQSLLAAATAEKTATLTIDEIAEVAGGNIVDLRKRSWWASNQRGGRDWDRFRKSGLVFSFVPDRRGSDVEYVVFRPDLYQSTN